MVVCDFKIAKHHRAHRSYFAISKSQNTTRLGSHCSRFRNRKLLRLSCVATCDFTWPTCHIVKDLEIDKWNQLLEVMLQHYKLGRTLKKASKPVIPTLSGNPCMGHEYNTRNWTIDCSPEVSYFWKLFAMLTLAISKSWTTTCPTCHGLRFRNHEWLHTPQVIFHDFKIANSYAGPVLTLAISNTLQWEKKVVSIFGCLLDLRTLDRFAQAGTFHVGLGAAFKNYITNYVRPVRL